MPGSVTENRHNDGEAHEELAASEPISSAAATMRPQRVIGIGFFRTVLMEVAIAMITPTSPVEEQEETKRR